MTLVSKLPLDVIRVVTSNYNDSSGVTIGRAVHAGPALWGAQNLPDAVF